MMCTCLRLARARGRACNIWQEWEHIPARVIIQRHEPERFGSLGWQQSGQAFPVIIDALLASGHRRLLRLRELDFLRLFEIVESKDLASTS